MNKRKADLQLQSHHEYLASIAHSEKLDRPNIVLIMVDDMGHGDISCYGSRAIHTPSLDAMAQSGVKMTNFYAPSPLCSPSRFGCLTGRYPNRGFLHSVFFPSTTWMGRAQNRARFPFGIHGILPDEITLAEALQRSGYKTGIFGKWHLGDTSPHLPNEKGFDYFFGSYYSNDMTPYAYYRNEKFAIQAPADQTLLTGEITREIITFIGENKHHPFLVYYPSPFSHHPAHASPGFTGSSKGGTYGDCVQEIDWSVGEIRTKLAELGLVEKTLVIFTSDNGPWFEGSPGYHRGRKGNNFYGGQIVPMIACWPGVIPEGNTVDIAAMNIDFFPTFLNMAEIPLPADRTIDGMDLLPILKGEATKAMHEELCFITRKNMIALHDRENFKYHDHQASENSVYSMMSQGPFLFDLNHDPSESYDVTAHYPEKAAAMRKKLEAKRQEMNANPRGWKK